MQGSILGPLAYEADMLLTELLSLVKLKICQFECRQKIIKLLFSTVCHVNQYIHFKIFDIFISMAEGQIYLYIAVWKMHYIFYSLQKKSAK